MNLKEKILKLMDTTESPVFFSDLSEALDADLKVVVDACKELLDEGKISICKNSDKRIYDARANVPSKKPR